MYIFQKIIHGAIDNCKQLTSLPCIFKRVGASLVVFY